MRLFLYVLIVFIVAGSTYPFSVTAADYTAKSVKAPRVEKNPNDEDKKAKLQTAVCTDEDRQMIAHHNEILEQYKANSEYYKAHPEEIKKAKDIDNMRGVLMPYMDFIQSTEFKTSGAVRKRCNLPPPPDPIGWPFWAPIDNPIFKE